MDPIVALDAVLGRYAGATMAFTAIAERMAFLTAFAGAARAMRGRTAVLARTEAEALRQAGLVAPQLLTMADLARTRLLLGHLRLLPFDRHAAVIAELVGTGDNDERQAVLKVLMLLPAPGRFIDIACDAMRAAVVDTVAAIACDNAYPAAHFSADAFRAMVLKLLHLGLDLSRVHGLESRRDGELARMGRDYASERRAAGRSVSPDVVLLTGEPL